MTNPTTYQANTSANEDSSSTDIKLGISACLLGQKVRYNGGHSQSKLCLKTLSQHFSFEAFCPEVAAGFGTPRPTMRLIGSSENPTLAYSNDNTSDLTQQLKDGFSEKLKTMGTLDGYILMKNSPSCGLDRIKVYQENGYPQEAKSRGIFTTALLKKYPNLPVEEEGRLNDHRLRENFILRVYAHNAFRQLLTAQPCARKLMEFHGQYKYILMAHNQSACKALGRLVASTNSDNLSKVLDEYFSLFMKTLTKPANSKNHTNVLLHLLGYLRGRVSPEARQNIAEVIRQYHQGYVPLISPILLIKHYIEQVGSEYIRKQRYFQPYPQDLGLSNNI